MKDTWTCIGRGQRTCIARGPRRGDECAKSGLDIGEKENEPVEAAQALARRGGRRFGRFLGRSPFWCFTFRWQRHITAACDGPQAAVIVGPVNRIGGKRYQNVSPGALSKGSLMIVLQRL